MVNLTTEKIGFNERLVSASFNANANFEKFYPHWENRLKRVFLHFFATTRIRGKYSRARRILYWMCEEEVNLIFCFPCKLMMSKNFDCIKHDQSEAKIVFAIPVNSSFQAVNLRFFLAFTAPVKWSNVDFLSHLPLRANT